MTSDVIYVKVPCQRHQGNVQTYVTDRFHAEIYFRSTQESILIEYALSRSRSSQIGYLVSYATSPTKLGKFEEDYLRMSSSSEFMSNSV